MGLPHVSKEIRQKGTTTWTTAQVQAGARREETVINGSECLSVPLTAESTHAPGTAQRSPVSCRLEVGVWMQCREGPRSLLGSVLTLLRSQFLAEE